MITYPNNPQQHGFSYVEVLVASFLLAACLVPAMEALQTGILSTSIHEKLTMQHYRRLKKMQELLAEPFTKLVSAAETATNNTTPTTYSDAAGTIDRNIVYIALYDADANPFTITDTNTDNDNNLYTGETANLVWVKVATEGAAQALETLVSRQ